MRTLLTVLIIVLFGTPPARSGEWGDLRMRIMYDGELPEPRAWVADKDVAVCGKTKLLDESLLVDKESRGIANVVVMLLKPKDGEAPVHESYEKAAKEPAKIVSKHCRFEPHILLMRTTQPLEWENPDPIGHVPRFGVVSNRSFGDLIPASNRQRYDFPKEEADPVRLECLIHPWMSAVIILRGNPYAALSDKQGQITLKNVPAGDWTFRIWHERAGNITKARQGDNSLNWTKGRIRLTIKPGENDAGEFQLSAKLFERR